MHAYMCTYIHTYIYAYIHIHTYIHSFIPAISIATLQVLYHSEALPTTARILYRSFTPKRTGNSTAGEGLAEGAYVAARAGVEPTTLRLKAIVSTKAPPRPTQSVETGKQDVGVYVRGIKCKNNRKWE